MVLQPTPKNVKTMVDSLKARDDVTAVEIAEMLGVSYGSLKRNMMEGENARPMSAPTWQLLLLLCDRHPHYRLVPKISRQKSKRSARAP